MTSPGRNVQSILEAPHPFDPVVPTAASDQHSRLGPVVRTRDGVFHHMDPGKYSRIDDNFLPEEILSYSDAIPLQKIPLVTVKERLLVYYQNVRGLRTKIDDFFIAVAECNFDIIVLTETWLDEKIYSAQLFGNLFTVFRCDRNSLNSRKSRGGGVLIAVSARLNAFIDPAPICNTLEQIWVRVKLPHQMISVGVIYLPPNRRADPVSISDHILSIEAVMRELSLSDLALLFGDYNQSGLVWKFPINAAPIVDSLKSHISVACAALLDGFNVHGLEQNNSVVNRNSRLLDYVLTSDYLSSTCLVQEAADPIVPLDADHPALQIFVDTADKIEFEDIVDMNGLDYRRADFSALTTAIASFDWQCLETFHGIDEAVIHFTHVMNRLLLDSVPTRKPPHKPPWGDAHLRRLKRLRSTALRKYSKYRHSFAKQQFNLASSNYRTYNRFLYKRYTLRMQTSLRRNPKLFWSFVNSKKQEGGLPVNMFLGNNSANTAREKCELFATHFKNSFKTSVASSAQIASAIVDTPRDILDLLT